jgi:hypothetical protein
MIVILTGDIVGARRQVATGNWLQPLQKILYEYGATPRHWEIQRGDYFQLEISDPAKALETAIKIKLAAKSVKGMDARIAIGVGDKTFASDSLSSAGGSAFIRSYRAFDILRRKKLSLLIDSGDGIRDRRLNLLFAFAMELSESWSINTSPLLDLAIRHPNYTQEQLASALKVTQASVSSGLKRSGYKLIAEMLGQYREDLRTPGT